MSAQPHDIDYWLVFRQAACDLVRKADVADAAVCSIQCQEEREPLDAAIMDCLCEPCFKHASEAMQSTP